MAGYRGIRSRLVLPWVIATIGSGCGPAVEVADAGTTGIASSTGAAGPTSGVSSTPPSASATAPSTSTTSTTVPATTAAITTGSVTSTTGSTATADTTGGTASCFEPEFCGDFIGCPDLAIEEECDVWLQDCPEGQHCVPDYQAPTVTMTCVAVPAEPLGLGEPCINDPLGCAEGLICRDLPSFAAGTVYDVCRPLCTGSPDAPQCPDGMFCVVEDIPTCYGRRDCNFQG